MLTFIINLLLSVSLFAQTTWTKYSNNPVLDIGPPGVFDDGHIWHHSVLFEEQTYKMWFTGAPVNRSAGQIGFANSTDGTNWSKDSANPIVSPGAVGEWDNPIVLNPVVIRDGDTLKMWYGGNNFNKGRVGYATSTDGITWIKSESNPVMDSGPPGSWDELGAVPQTVIFDGNTYHMWYFGPDTGFRFRIGYATSPDGITWTKYDDPSTTESRFAESDPVLKAGPPGSWDANSVANHWVLFDGSIFHMWYEAFDQNSEVRVGYATSSDGIIWEKYDDPNTTSSLFVQSDPVLLPGPFRSWDDATVGQPKVLLEGNTFHMWYIGNSANSGNFRIGYATSPLVTTVATHDVAPRSFALAQSFPNPFNPSTTIHFTLSEAAHVALKIFNVAGQEVATLVDNRMSAGEFETVWNAGRMPSGVYVYRLNVGGFVESKKMILLK